MGLKLFMFARINKVLYLCFVGEASEGEHEDDGPAQLPALVGVVLQEPDVFISDHAAHHAAALH